MFNWFYKKLAIKVTQQINYDINKKVRNELEKQLRILPTQEKIEYTYTNMSESKQFFKFFSELTNCTFNIKLCYKSEIDTWEFIKFEIVTLKDLYSIMNNLKIIGKYEHRSFIDIEIITKGTYNKRKVSKSFTILKHGTYSEEIFQDSMRKFALQIKTILPEYLL